MPGFLLEASGGGGHFTTFLEKELIPHIDSHYPAAPYRVIIGHSFGGLTAIHHLLNQDRLFHAYVAIDPSLWWDNLNYLRQVKERFPKVKLKNVSLFVAVANTMSGSLTRQTVIEDKSPGTLPIRALLDFDRFVKESGSDLIYRSKFYQDYDHGSVPLVAVYDALPFIFNFYAVNLPFGEFFDPHYKNDSLLINHYQQVSERMGYRIPPPGELVDALAHQLMDSHQLDRAYKFLQLNLRSYPGSYKTHEAMGDYYRAKNDQARAVEFYLQALAIKETSDVRAKLEKLKN